MKIRNGLVSNSSSSSFCVFGVRDFSIKSPVELLRTLKNEFPNEFSKLVTTKKSYTQYHTKNPSYGKLVEWMSGDLIKSPYQSNEKRGCEHRIGGEGDEMTRFCPECGKPTWVTEQVVCEEDMELFLLDDLYDLFNSFSSLQYVSGEGFEAVGFNYSSAPDNMTFGEFRTKANELISKIIGEEVKCEHICEDYYC